MSAAIVPAAGKPTRPEPLRWTVQQFHTLVEHGVFRGQYVMLIHGRILEQHHGDPSSPDPRPLRWTREQYHKAAALGFFNGLQVELVRWEIYVMSPKGWPHVVGCRKVAERLERVFAGAGWISRQEPIVVGGQEPEPDVAVIPGRFEDYADHPATALLVVEVADTTVDYDTTVKAEQYATGGIADYWVLDVDSRRLLVFRDPAPIAAGGAAYRTHLPLGPADYVSPLAAPGATIAVADLLP
jgi:Uma2 family endonuclease